MASVVVLCGGVGAARLLRGMVGDGHGRLTAVVNVGDDVRLHGLHISPDLDTITYTLADAVSPDRGWGLDNESWQAMEMVGRYGGIDWFSLGDRDLGTHLYRTHRLSEGATLTEVTAEITAAWGLELPILPVTDDPLRTLVRVADVASAGDDAGREIAFQEYFVRLRHDVPVTDVRFEGEDDARLTPAVADALDAADVIVIAPSNPVVSIDPVLAVGGLRDRLAAERDKVVAVSPIVGGQALKGPAARLLRELGREASVGGVAQWYSGVVGTLVIDAVDAELASTVEAAGVRPVVTDTIMATPERAAALGRVAVAAVVG